MRWLSRIYYHFILIFLLPVFVPCGAFAQSIFDPSEDPSAQIAEWTTTLDASANELDGQKLTDERLFQLRDELETIRRDARRWIEKQAPSAEVAEKELSALGPSPEEGAEPETAGIAEQRQELKAQLADVVGPIKEAELIVGRTNRQIAMVAKVRRANFTEKLLTPGPSPLSPTVWRLALPELKTIVYSILQSVADLADSPETKEHLRESILVLIGAVVFVIILVWPLNRWLLRRYGRDPSVSRPKFMQAARATIVVGAARALLPTAAAATVYIVLLSEEILSEAGEGIARASFFGVVLFYLDDCVLQSIHLASATELARRCDHEQLRSWVPRHRPRFSLGFRG